MTDLFDRAQQFEQQARERALQNRPKSTALSAFECEDCGEPIPELRRKTIQGVCRCVSCQTIFEHKQQNFRR